MEPPLAKVVTMVTQSQHVIFLANPGDFLRQKGATLYFCVSCYFPSIFTFNTTLICCLFVVCVEWAFVFRMAYLISFYEKVLKTKRSIFKRTSIVFYKGMPLFHCLLYRNLLCAYARGSDFLTKRLM